MTEPVIYFQEITTLEALIPFLHLRYRLFQGEGKSESLYPPSTEGIDLDVYDTRSYHLGVYRMDEAGQPLPAGYSRLIADAPTPLGAELHRLGERYPHTSRCLQTPPADTWLTSERVPELREQLGAYIAEARQMGCKRIFEVSRTCLAPETRSFSATRWLFTCQMMFGLRYVGLGATFTTFEPDLAVLYKRLGMSPLSYFEWQDVPYATFTIQWFDLLPSKQSELEAMADTYRREGRVVFGA